ncbi:cleavage stimulation factor subunit 1-like [Watersipora subatra]|uniref:cleavage stimulation factor subunit 1-like n=1 Tax=Watersipora subatra TaxID=2589382 RepID=UPI00355BE6F5
MATGDFNFTVKDREIMYRLIISQLFYDGHQNLAVSLATAVKAHPACSPSDRLMKVLHLGLREEEDYNDAQKQALVLPGSGVDLEFETDVKSISPDAFQYQTLYVTSHKGPCKVGIFHPKGNLVATGSEDCSIKVLDVNRMIAKADETEESEASKSSKEQMESHPVIRTLYDHTAGVTCLDFHIASSVLISGSTDRTVKVFDYSRSSTKKAQRSIQEAYPVKCLHLHPKCDWLLVGTEHPTMRLYDVTTQQCFVGSNPKDQHSGPITTCKWSMNAKMFATGSADGNIKLWDGVSNKCFCTFSGAHSGTEIVSVAFSRNSKYLLTAGMDSMVKLWELSTSRCLIAYTGAGTTGKMTTKTNAVFNHTEDYVLFPDERTTSLCCWDSRNAERQPLLSLSHNNCVTSMCHSPISATFITCSDDNRMRFWHCRSASESI